MMRCWSKDAARGCGISPCSIRVTLQPFSLRRNAATMPAAPAPTTTTCILSSLGEGETKGQADEHDARNAVEPAAEGRRIAQHAGRGSRRGGDDHVHRGATDVENEAQHQDLHDHRALRRI